MKSIKMNNQSEIYMTHFHWLSYISIEIKQKKRDNRIAEKKTMTYIYISWMDGNSDNDNE